MIQEDLLNLRGFLNNMDPDGGIVISPFINFHCHVSELLTVVDEALAYRRQKADSEN